MRSFDQKELPNVTSLHVQHQKMPTCKFPGCSRTVFIEQSGKAHEFCGRTHAQQYSQQQMTNVNNQTGALNLSGPVCKLASCNKPAAVDSTTGKVFDFCCRDHADEHRNNFPQLLLLVLGSTSSSSGSQQQNSPNIAAPATSPPQTKPNAKCLLPTCTLSPSSPHKYCCKNHADQHSKEYCKFSGCAKKKFNDGHKVHDYCCKTHAQQDMATNRTNSPCISHDFVKLSSNDPKYQELAKQFYSKWTHPSSKKAKPTVIGILALNVPDILKKKFTHYQEWMANQNVKCYGNADKGNCVRRFHGTSLDCDIINTCIPCSTGKCGVCGIFKSGWLLKFSKTNTGAARYGDGLYFSSTSSKSDDYAQNTNQSYRAMVIAKVVAGVSYRATESWDPNYQLPNGYHSTIGDPKYDKDINYDELVVYAEYTCLPAYVILYK